MDRIRISQSIQSIYIFHIFIKKTRFPEKIPPTKRSKNFREEARKIANAHTGQIENPHFPPTTIILHQNNHHRQEADSDTVNSLVRNGGPLFVSPTMSELYFTRFKNRFVSGSKIERRNGVTDRAIRRFDIDDLFPRRNRINFNWC